MSLSYLANFHVYSINQSIAVTSAVWSVPFTDGHQWSQVTYEYFMHHAKVIADSK